MNDIAVVTGASSGIGMAIAKKLVDANIEVYGIGRDFSNTDSELLKNLLFHKCEFDLSDDNKLDLFLNNLKSVDVSIVINNAGCAYYGLCEDISASKIRSMAKVNFEVPLVITCFFMKKLKQNKGTIINIASTTAISMSNTHGAVYGATKAGLYSFSNSIFDEARKYGVRVCTIMPDMTDTNLYRNADFGVDSDKRAYLDKDVVAKTALSIINADKDFAITQIVLKPILHRIKRKK